MGRTEKLTVYVSESDRNRIEREADSQGVSVSSYFMQAVERQWERDDVEAAADQLAVEEKVEQIVADARDELVGIARAVERRNDDVADMTARAGSYSIANFELLKDEFDPAESRKAESLLVGSRRLRKPIDEHPDRDLGDGDGDEGEDNDKELTIAEEFFRDRGRLANFDPDEFDEYGLHPDEEYYDIKREEAEVYEAERRKEREGGLPEFFAAQKRDSPTDREAAYIEAIPEDERTDHQDSRLWEYRKEQREWREERRRIHREARREHEKRKEEQNSGLSGLFRG